MTVAVCFEAAGTVKNFRAGATAMSPDVRALRGAEE